MPWIVSVVLGGLLQIVGSLVGRVLLALGLGFVEYTGINMLIESAKSSALSLIGGVGSSVIADWAGFLMIDQHVSIILSAIGAKVALNALGGASVKRLVHK